MGSAGTPTFSGPRSGGSVGPPGPQGPTGPPGPPGLEGSPGEDGEQGNPGPQGPQGPIGATGAAGSQGPPGFPGFDGEDGDPGPPGPMGPQGATGATGVAGATGSVGPPGADGIDGEDGIMGPPGPIGITGMRGMMGPPGLDADGDGFDPILVGFPDLTNYLFLPGRAGSANNALLSTTSDASIQGSSALNKNLALIPGPNSVTGKLLVGSATAASAGFVVDLFNQHVTSIIPIRVSTDSTDVEAIYITPGINGTSLIEWHTVSVGLTASIDSGGSSGTKLRFGAGGGYGFYNQATVGSGTEIATIDTAGNITGKGSAHNLGTTGASCAIQVGQGTTGTDTATLQINSGNSGATTTRLWLSRNGGVIAGLTYNGSHTIVDYTTDVQFRTAAITGTVRATLDGTGQLRLGDATAPTALLDLIGKLTGDTNGVVTRYNNIATVSGGVPAEYATIDLVTQATALGPSLLYAVPAARGGMYRISYVATVTRAATTSSTLGGAGLGVQIDWTDNDTGVAKLSPAGAAVAAGTNTSLATPTNSANTTAASISGCIIVSAQASTNINYRIGYTSAGATTMQFNLHIKIEAM